VSLGATLIDFTGGENLEESCEIKHALAYYKVHSFLGYLIAASEVASHPENGKSPPVRLDMGPFGAEGWVLLQPHFLGAKLLLTTVDNTVAQEGALSKAPTHAPEYRLQSIIYAGDAGIPLTTGIMIGIGESRESRGKAIRVLAQVASRYGHIRSVLIQAFRPHPATPMAHHKPASLEEMLETVTLARRHLPPFVRVQINALDWGGHLPELVRAGADDLGDLSLKVLKWNSLSSFNPSKPRAMRGESARCPPVRAWSPPAFRKPRNKNQSSQGLVWTPREFPRRVNTRKRPTADSRHSGSRRSRGREASAARASGSKTTAATGYAPRYSASLSAVSRSAGQKEQGRALR
jgi:7,8-didemethyl-8-hydroxy-5-deazariboflavin synthase CofG subunit